MAYEVFGGKRKIKRYKLHFLNSDNDHVKKIRFKNYDKYDRRDALKRFLNMSYVRHLVETDEELELTENNPTMKNFLTANHSSYGNMKNTAMKSFVTKNQTLSSTSIRGKIDPRQRVLMENPNAFALLFKDKYKHDNKNPRAKSNNYMSRKDDFHRKKQLFREKIERKKKKLEERKKKKRV